MAPVQPALRAGGGGGAPVLHALGALLLGSDKTDDPAYLLRRRLPRVAVPGLFWSLLVVVGVWLTQGGEAALLKFVNLPAISVLTPYWFLYALIPITCSRPCSSG